MKIFKTIAFGFIFLMLVTYYYLHEVKHYEEMNKKKEEEKKVFTGITKDGIQKFTVHGPKGEATLQREGDVWMLKSPVSAKGDQEAAKSLVEDLAGFKLESVIESDPRNYKDFGLETPALKIDFSTEKGEMSLWIGDENPTNTLAYGKSGSEPRIFAFSTSMKKQLDRGPYDLRDKTILPLEADKVKRVSLFMNGTRLDASLSEAKTWEATSPFQWRADKEKLNGIIQSIRDSQIKMFVTEKPSSLEEFGLASPVFTLSFFSGKDGEETGHALLIGKKEEGQNRFYAKLDGADNVFQIEGSVVEKIPLKAEDLRDKKLLAMNDSEDVAGLRLSGKETVQVKKNEKGDWEIIEPKKAKADLFATNQWADKIAKAAVQDFLDGKSKDAPEYGLTQPDAVIEIWEKEAGKEPQKILIGKEAGEGQGRYAALAAMPNVFTISDETYKGLIATGAQLRGKKLVHFDTEEIERIEALKGAQKTEFKKSGDEWKAHPSGKKVEGNAARRLLWDIMDLEFSRVASEDGTELNRFGLGAPFMSLKLWKAKGELACEVSFGNKVPEEEGAKAENKEGEGDEKYYAVNETKSEVYEVKTGLVRELEKKLEEWGVKQ